MNDDRWFERVLNLAVSIRTCAGSLVSARFVALFVDAVDPAYRDALARFDVEVRVVERYDDRCVYFNKLRMLALADELEFDVLLALDCDVVLVGDVAALLDAHTVCAAPDWGGPFSDTEWEVLYDGLNLPRPAKVIHPYRGGVAYPYVNSGVIAVPHGTCRTLERTWMRRAEDIWRVYRPPSTHAGHRYSSCDHQWEAHDQLAFSCALVSGEFPTRQWPVGTNYPTGVLAPGLTDVEPLVLHYRSNIDRRGFLRPSGLAAVDERIRAFNVARAAALSMRYRPPAGEPWAKQWARRSTTASRLAARAVRLKYWLLEKSGRTPRRISHL